ncbi:MAG: hypothetical protein IT206_07465 [Fimbriimonadaceae bacterium]|nr:hypothetical protein [Fimbriimonadaceae bacterium]
MSYFVVDSNTGQKYGPADIDVLNQWIAEGRVTPQTVLEDADTGSKIGAGAIAGLNFGIAPPPATPMPPATDSYPNPSSSSGAPFSAPSPYPRDIGPSSDQSGKIIGSYVCSVIGIFCCPIVLCSVGIMLANQAKDAGDQRGVTAKTVGIVCLVIGILFGVLSLGLNRR